MHDFCVNAIPGSGSGSGSGGGDSSRNQSQHTCDFTSNNEVS